MHINVVLWMVILDGGCECWICSSNSSLSRRSYTRGVPNSGICRSRHGINIPPLVGAAQVVEGDAVIEIGDGCRIFF